MVAVNEFPLTDDDAFRDEALFTRISNDLEAGGFSIHPGALPEEITASLYAHQRSLDRDMYVAAGVGRRDGYLKNGSVRSDAICWINGDSPAGTRWLRWAARLQCCLNRRLFLGLFSFESHFAHYAPGNFYKRHYDAFRGETNRVLSIAVYLNSGWTAADGGELVLYRDEGDSVGIRVAPGYGTIVVFLSEAFPHEVLPAHRDRYSVAGWFRVNTSIQNNIDPPS